MLRAVAIFGRYDSKFMLLGGVLSVRLEATFIKSLLNISAIIFLSVISYLNSLGIYNGLHDIPSVFDIVFILF